MNTSLRETEQMMYEEGLTRQQIRRRRETEMRQKELLNRSIEDRRREKEKIRSEKEKYQYRIYELYKLGDYHKQHIYYTRPYTLDLEIMRRIEEEDQREIENRRRKIEDARWAIEDRRTREEDHSNRLYRKRFAFQELGFHLRVLEVLQMTHRDPRVQHAMVCYHREAVLNEMKQILFYRTQL